MYTVMGKVTTGLCLWKQCRLAGIEASLNMDPECEVIGHTMAGQPAGVVRAAPDVVIFELDARTPDFGFSLAKEIPACC